MKQVSIVVPIYNSEKFLARCLQSLQQQTYQSIEILLIDDGSTDQSAVICREAAKQDSRITVVHQSNAGLGAARNRGIDEASGDYICFVDSDDYVDPCYVETLLKNIQRTNADIAICNHWSIQEGQPNETAVENPAFVKYTGPAREYYKKLLTNTRLNLQAFVWRCLYKRTVFDSEVTHVRFATGQLIEDVLLMMQLYTKSGLKVTTQATPLYYYVQHPASLTRQTNFTYTILNTIADIERSPALMKDELVYKHLNILKYLPIYRWKKRALLHPADAALVRRLRPDYAACLPNHWLVELYQLDPRLGVLTDLIWSRCNK